MSREILNPVDEKQLLSGAAIRKKTAVVLVNLGTPAGKDVRSVRKFLAEFLWDPRVVELPRPLWWLILNWVILTIRPRKSAQAYANVWTDEGSPLLVLSEKLKKNIQQQLSQNTKGDIIIELAMRYGQPSIKDLLTRLQSLEVERLIVLPMYPQYSATTTASIFDAVTDYFRRQRNMPELVFIKDYYQHHAYINAIAQSITEHFDVHGQPDKLVFSFHGIPERYVCKGDPYAKQCEATVHAVAAQLNLASHQYCLTYQSRLGREKWLMPYTIDTIQQLPDQGCKSIAVVCPGFAVDCLETIEEIDMENREVFLAAGGEHFVYIPALNDSVSHRDCYLDILRAYIDF